MQVQVVAVHEQVLTVEVSFMGSDKFHVSFVYAKCDHILRRPLWSHWMIVRDFNAIVSSSERKGGSPPSFSVMSEFIDFINSLGLLDCGFKGSHLHGAMITMI